MGYRLRDDLSFCTANDKSAFLDHRLGKYFCLPPRAECAFQSLVNGRSLSENEIVDLLPLISQGMLVDWPGEDTAIEGTSLSPPSKAAMDEFAERPDALQCVYAAIGHIQSDIGYRPISLMQTVEMIKRRKIRKVSNSRSLTDTGVRRSVSAFLSTRRLMVTQDRCIRWSISMINHLARSNYYPSLVIGVSMKPFGAHAWVQDGDYVLSDYVDNVLPFTPILVV